jgi:cytochrome P450
LVDYDPFSEEVMRDPHPVYRRLRAESPVHYLEKYDAWALALFEDIWNASLDDAHLTATRGTSSQYLLTRTIPALPNLNHMDPPAHTRLRAAVAPYFMPRRVRSLEPRIRGFVTECIDAFAARGSADVVTELAQIVAVRVACLAVGFPESDSRYIIDLVKRFMSREEGVTGMTQIGVEAFAEMQRYLTGLAAERRGWRGEPRDPIDVFLAAEVEGERLSDELIGQHLILLLVGATETFPKAFSAAVYRLWQHPDQRAELVADPARIPTALRECLRYDMPTQFLMRSVKAPWEIGGKTLKPGSSVMFLYPSGNRDEREFRDPDRFDIHRNPPRILTFGHGIHRCLGANFAEMEGKLLLEELLRRMPRYEVDEAGIRRERTDFIQGMLRLPLHWETARV